MNLSEELKKMPKKARFVSEDIFSQLPEQYTFQTKKVEFSIERDFLKQGFKEKTVYAPSATFLDRVADACGISMIFPNGKISETLFDLVDINPMLCAELGAPARTQRIETGYRVTTTMQKRIQDGSIVTASEFKAVNYWDKAKKAWFDEEAATECYSENMIAEGNKYITYKGEYKNENKIKYKSPYKRRQSLEELKQHALEKASTGSRSRAIKFLAGFPSNFKQEDLKTGYFILGKIIKSAGALKAEQAAHLIAIERGNSPTNEAIAQLTGPAITLVDEQPTEPVILHPPPPVEIINITPTPHPEEEKLKAEEIAADENESLFKKEAVEKIIHYVGLPGWESFFPKAGHPEKVTGLIEKIPGMSYNGIIAALSWVEKQIPDDIKDSDIPF